MSAFANTTLGLIDVQKVIVSVSEGKKVMKQLEKEFNKKKSELQKEEEGIKKLQADYQKQSLVLSDDAKQKKQREIQESIMQLQQKTMGYQKEIQEMERKLKQPIVEKIEKIVEEVSKAEGVAMTFEAGASPVLYAESKKDLTEQVIKAYDKKFK